MKLLLILITTALTTTSFAQARQCTMGDLKKAQIEAIRADMLKNSKSVLFNKDITINKADAAYITPDDSRSAKDYSRGNGNYSAGSISFIDTTYVTHETVSIIVKLNKNCGLSSYKMEFESIE